jgi:hypothetical protein
MTISSSVVVKPSIDGAEEVLTYLNIVFDEQHPRSSRCDSNFEACNCVGIPRSTEPSFFLGHPLRTRLLEFSLVETMNSQLVAAERRRHIRVDLLLEVVVFVLRSRVDDVQSKRNGRLPQTRLPQTGQSVS